MPALPRAARAPAARCRPRSWRRSRASTSPTRASGRGPAARARPAGGRGGRGRGARRALRRRRGADRRSTIAGVRRAAWVQLLLVAALGAAAVPARPHAAARAHRGRHGRARPLAAAPARARRARARVLTSVTGARRIAGVPYAPLTLTTGSEPELRIPRLPGTPDPNPAHPAPPRRYVATSVLAAHAGPGGLTATLRTNDPAARRILLTAAPGPAGTITTRHWSRAGAPRRSAPPSTPAPTRPSTASAGAARAPTCAAAPSPRGSSTTASPASARLLLASRSSSPRAATASCSTAPRTPAGAWPPTRAPGGSRWAPASCGSSSPRSPRR